MRFVSSTAQRLLTPQQRDAGIEKHIPYARHVDDHTIETKSGELLQVIRLQGIAADTLDDAVIDQFKTQLHSLFRNLQDSSVAIYTHLVRAPCEISLTPSTDSAFVQELTQHWQTQLNQKQLFTNAWYLTVVKKAPEGWVRKSQHALGSLSRRWDQASREQYRQRALAELQRVTTRIVQSLQAYQPRVLGAQTRTASRAHSVSELLSFFSRLLHGESREVALLPADSSQYLGYQRFFFDRHSGRIILRDAQNRLRYAAIVSIKQYAASTYAGMFDALLDAPFAFQCAQSFAYFDPQSVKRRMRDHAKKLTASDSGALTQLQDIDVSVDALSSQAVGFGEHTLSILCWGDSDDAVNQSVQWLDARFNALDYQVVREDVAIEAAFWAQLPANFAYRPRPALISTRNFASLSSLHNAATGKAHGNHWGEAVTVLETLSGTPYYFNFHVNDVGNTVIIGPMGRGKTLLECFLIAESLKLGGRRFIFDKDRGTEIFVRAAGGTYAQVKRGEPTGFNPLLLSDTPSNRAFLSQWLHALLSVSGEPLTADDSEVIQHAVDGVFTLPTTERQLRTLAPFFGMKKAGSLRQRFSVWIDDGEYAWVFDHPTDHWSLDHALMGVDVGNIIEDPVCCGPIFLYLFHRIDQLMDGSPTAIVIAEGWRPLQNAAFKAQVLDWSKTPRKKNTLMIIDTQDPADFAKAEVSTTVIQESVTQIFFANYHADEATYRQQYQLTEKEFAIVRDLPDDARFFLLKQGKQSAVVRLDLSGLSRDIAVLSGRTQTVQLLDQLRQQVGDDPEDWLPLFYQAIEKKEGSPHA